ncbi:MAG: hypothetical protein WC451_02375 [Patescibacteria group bacterium]
MDKQNKKDWLSEIEDKYYWVESLSGWLLAICMAGGFYLLSTSGQNYYGWLLFKISFIFLFITLFYKGIIYAIVYVGIKIKVRKGSLELKDPIKDTVHDYIQGKNRAK